MKGILAVLLLVSFVSPCAQAGKIIFTSNVPELYAQENGYSLAKMSAFVQRLKQGTEPVLFIHGGDSLSPNSLSVYDKGVHMISIMNAMMVDVLAVNRREFNDGIDQVTLLSSQAQFPMVLSNLHDRRTMGDVEGLLPYVILPLGKLKVAVLMTVSENINSTFLFNTAVVYEDAEQINRKIHQARLEGADKVILVTERDYLKAVSVDRLQGVDCILVTQDVEDHQIQDHPLMVASGGVDDEMIVLNVSDESISAEIVHTAQEEPDASLNHVISRFTNQLDVVLDKPLTTLAGPMDSLRETLRSAESSFGNLVLDAIRHYTQADFAAVIGGSMRGYRTYEAGYQLTRRDVQRELPFGGTVHVVKVSPTKLKQILEHGVSVVEDSDGRFLQVSGLRYKYDASRPIGQRIVSISDALGKPLAKAEYTLAISDYMLHGGDDYDFSDVREVSDEVSSQRLVWNVVSDYLEQFDAITPSLDGRIENLTPVQ